MDGKRNVIDLTLRKETFDNTHTQNSRPMKVEVSEGPQFGFTSTIETSQCNLETGSWLSTPVFSLEGFDQFEFRLSLFPGGFNIINNAYVTISLLLISSKKYTGEVRVKSWFVNSNNGSKVYENELIETELPASRCNRVFHHSLPRSFFDNLLYNEQFTIGCRIKFVSGSITTCSRSIKTLPEEQKSRIVDDLTVLFGNKKCSDVTIAVGNREIRAHKAILAARSSVFAALFTKDTKEGNEKEENVVKVVDMDHESVVEMLRYIYTGKVLKNERISMELLAASDKYAIPGLKVECENALRDYLKVDNAARILMCADLHKAEELRTNAMIFICKNALTVAETKGFKKMVNSHPHLVAEAFTFVATKKKRSLEQ